LSKSSYKNSNFYKKNLKLGRESYIEVVYI